MLRLLLLETTSAFVERLAAALSSDDIASCEHMNLKRFEALLSDAALNEFDAVVVDLRQQFSDLRGTCHRISRRLKSQPLIAVTSLDNVDSAVRLIEAGADEVCLRNESDAECLLKRIRMATARRLTQAEILETVGSFGYLEPQTPSYYAELEERELPEAGPGIQVLCLDPLREVESHETTIHTAGFDLPVNVQSVVSMGEALPTLRDEQVDVVAVRFLEATTESLELLMALRAFAPTAHIFFSCPGAEPEFIVDAVRHGADDFLTDTIEMSPAMIRCLRSAFARKWRLSHNDDNLDDSLDDNELDEAQSNGLSAGRPAIQSRNPRYFITKSAVAIPINPDFTPNQTVCAEGFTVDISATGIGFEIGSLSELPSELLLAGVEGDDGNLYFATVQIQHWRRIGNRMFVGVKFVSPERELLRPENLLPRLDPQSLEFRTGLPQQTLVQWAELGILRPVLVDRVYVCPKCHVMPSFRKGCRSCGSIHIASHDLVLHADCAYLGTITEFDRNGQLICPKCGRTEDLDKSAFERHHGPCRCLDCNWSDSDTEVVGQCLKCGWHFPLKNASERDLIGFAVNRLDPRAFFGGL
jgi:DNA-binding NarL/FixJ family response regulator